MLNDQQKKVVFDIPGNTIVSASPGSGKTRSLVARAQYKLEKIPPHKTLALITYTNAAADEIASRLISHNEIFIGTIHRFCLEFILRPFGWLYNWKKPRVVSYDELIKFLENNSDIDLGTNQLDELGKIRKNVSGELDLSIDWDNPSDLNKVAQRFSNFLDTIKAIDFNEILFRSYKIVSEQEFVAVSLGNKFFEILVDEFQDTNIFQYEIFKKINNAGPCTFFLVGDEKQKIYRFAGAIDNASKIAIDDFQAEHEELTLAYRSTENIVNFYSSLFAHHPKIRNESIYKDVNIPIEIREASKDNHSQVLTTIVYYLINTIKLSLPQIAVLSARWTDSLLASKYLRKKYSVVGLGALPHPTRNLNNSTFNLLRALAQYHCSSSIRSLRAVKRGIELHLLENNIEDSEEFSDFKKNTLIAEFRRINSNLSITDGLDEIKNVFENIFEIQHSTFDDIFDRITDDEKSIWTIGKYFQALSGLGGITSNTIHQTKGLEFEAVILNQMNEGRIPYQEWDSTNRVYLPASNESIEDGRNLFYVAISRAKQYLFILHNWRPSMFINQITDSLYSKSL